MSPDLRELGVVKRASPCRQSWDTMEGDERVRRCGGCGRTVYELERLDSEQARALLLEHEGRPMCVRYWQRADGRLMTYDCPDRGRRARARLRLTALAVALLLAALAYFADNLGRLFAMSRHTPTLATHRAPRPWPKCFCNGEPY